MSVKAGVCSSGQRRWADWAQLGIEGALANLASRTLF